MVQFLAASLIGVLALAAQAQDLPPDVESFLARRSACEHFIGEEPYDEERRRFLALRIRQACSGINEQGAATRELHRDSPAVLEALEPHREPIYLVR